MESILESLSKVNAVFDIWIADVISLENELETLNNRLNVTSGLIGKLTDNILNISGKSPKERELIEANHPTNNNRYEKDFFSPEPRTTPRQQSTDAKDDDENGFLNGFKGFTKLTGGIEKILGVFEEFYPALKNVHSIAKVVHGISEGGEGLSSLFSVAETGVSAAEGMAAGGELMAGAAGLAEASAVFGPAGWAIGAGAITTAAIISMVNARDTRTKKNYEKSLKIQEESLQTFEMPEADAKTYIQQMKHLPNEHLHEWRAPYNPIKENTAKYGVDAYTLNYPMSAQAIDNNRVRQFVPQQAKQTETVVPVGQSYLEQTFDLQQRLYNAGTTKGRDGFNQVALHAVKDAKDYDKVHHTHTADMTISAILEEQTNLLNDANEGSVVKENPKKHSARPAIYRNELARDTGNRTININRPLIENFIINTKEVKEGLNDFKHKVEEVLLEILNSTNQIH